MNEKSSTFSNGVLNSSGKSNTSNSQSSLRGFQKVLDKGRFSNTTFESAMLFILLLTLFRTYFLADQLLIAAVAFPLILFIALSIPFFLRFTHTSKIRVICLLLIVGLVYGFILKERINFRITNGQSAIVHDGGLQTEMAAQSILEGKNPYAITFDKVLKGERFYHNGQPDPVLTHFVYSPVTFLINIPVFLLSKSLFNIVDIRIALITFFLVSVFIGSCIVKEKILFLIVSLLNPLIINSIFLGANDVLALFFLIFCIVFLRFRKFSFATIALGMACGTKLTAIPFVPLYFLYLSNQFRKQDYTRHLIKEALIFLITSLIIYMPFVFWDARAIFEDLILFVFQGGNQTYPITGYLGLPHLLAHYKLISSWTNFPFYYIQTAITVLILIVSYKVLVKSPYLRTLCILYVLFLIISFSFGRTFQPNYLDFLSQILIFGSFIPDKLLAKQ